MSEKTFMDWDAGIDWTVTKPKSTNDATSLDFDYSNILDTTYTDMGLGTSENSSFANLDNVKTDFDFDFSSMFSADNIGGTMQGIGSVAGALANIYSISEQSKFNEDMLAMEKTRVNREYAKEDKQQANYDAVWE